MDILQYVFISAGIIMFWHMAFNTNPKDFGLMQMIGVFILGGVMGYYMHSLVTALMMSILLSLVFI